MNIFVISPHVHECAQALDDLRLNKMILETAQLLSVAARFLFRLSLIDDGALYRTTHFNHPCAIWARKNKHNFLWLMSYFNALELEREHRTGKKHLSFLKLFPTLLRISHNEYTAEDLISFTEAIPTFDFNCTDFKTLPVHEAYKKQLVKKWHNDAFIRLKPPKWSNRFAPSWAILTPKQELETSNG